MVVVIVGIVILAACAGIVKVALDGHRYYFLGDTDVLIDKHDIPVEKAAVLCQIARAKRLPAGGMMRSQTYVTERMYKRYMRKSQHGK